MAELLEKSIRQIHQDLTQGKVAVRDLIVAVYHQIEQLNPQLNALINVIEKDQVLEQANYAQTQINQGKASLLCGIPYVLKDSYLTKGVETTAASKVLAEYVGQYDATIYSRLKAAGAILVGKANMDAWGHGATNEHSDFGPVKNPWDLERVAGGSSGGCGVAVASRMCWFAIGEDTGGSIRNPAVWNGITGLKVTYGRVPRYGCIAYASSFDTVGPMTRSVEDAAAVLETIAGRDPYDASSAAEPVPEYSKQLGPSDKKITLGIPKELLSDKLQPFVRKALDDFPKQMEVELAEVVEVSMPSLTYALSVYYLIGTSETSSNLARYDGVRYGQNRSHFGPENVRRILLGSYALSAGYKDAYYTKAQQARTLMIQDYQQALDQCDVLLMPVTTNVASKLGESIQDPLENMLIDLFTTSQNPVGVPALAIPAGFSPEGMPFGLQLVGQKFTEPMLFQLAHAYQQKTKYHLKKPKLIDKS